MEDQTYCKNCQSEISGNYCSNCGQRASVFKVTFKETFQDFIDAVFSVNAPLWNTLKMLLINPGKLFREYLDGKRKSFYKPVAFFILMTVIYLIIRSLLNYDAMAGVAVVQNDNVDTTLFVNAGKYMVANINNILFLFVFAFGLSLKLFFYRNYSLAEFTAISFYLVGVYNILGTLWMFFLQFIDPTLKFVPMILMLFYVVYAFHSFFKENKVWVIARSILSFIVAYFLYASFGFGLSLLIVWLKNS